MSGYILNLKDEAAADIAVAGGKGANLAKLRLLQEVPVPDGFVVTAGTYRKAIIAQPWAQDAFARLGVLVPGDTAAIEVVSKEVRRKIVTVALPDGLRQEIAAALSMWSENTAFAVRSSATAEDLPSASFAGQQDTFLNVVGPEAVCSAVVGCWASLFTDRAVAYRIQNGFPHEQVSIAVVVQQMVESEVSGVMFTADPMTSDRFTTVIEAVPGLGEELVSGRKTPYQWKLRAGELKQSAKGDGDVPLGEMSLRELAQIGKRIQTAFAQEQDIEWCCRKGTFAIVQARPITTLYPAPESPDGVKHCALSIGHLQMMTDPVLPLGISLIQKSKFYAAIGLGGRMYTDITYDLGVPKRRKRHLSESGIKDPLMNSALREIAERKDYLRSIPKGGSATISIENRGAIIIQAVACYFRGDESVIDAYVKRQKSGIETMRGELDALSGSAALRYILDAQQRMRLALSDPVGVGATLRTC
jgi:pyruvate,water dikinase